MNPRRKCSSSEVTTAFRISEILESCGLGSIELWDSGTF